MAEPLGISMPIAPSGGVDQRLPTGTPIAAVTPRHDDSGGNASQAPPSTELHMGTTVEAIVRAPPIPNTPGPLAIGTRLLLRIVALPSSPDATLLIGRVIDSAGRETLVATALGLLALQRRLTLEPGTAIAFERLEEIPPETATADTPSQAGGWPALEAAMAVLTQAAPEIAARLRAELAPRSGAQLAGTLFFLLGALYNGDWPGAAVNAALTGASQAKLGQRLADDATELRRLGSDSATGEWQALTLPLLVGATVLPVRLFLRRRKPDAPVEDSIRFAVEVELSQFGPVQLDGLLRATHLILVLRSHRGLPQELRTEAAAVCRSAMQQWGLSGDLSFAVAAAFAVAPLAGLRKHIKVSI